MAVMEALLKIKADVTGEENVQKLGRMLGGLNDTAGRVTGGFKGMLGAAGGLTSALGGLVPMVSGVGLAAMAKGAIDTADGLSKMSARTGVSVERLSQLKQAAELSDSSIQAVGKSMAILSKNMKTENKGAMESLQSLGIAAKDATGQFRSADEILLDVADRFKAMPDGVEKTAMAMQLFGKSGAEMIPMLNGGRESIESLKATMTGDFAARSAEFNDQLTRVGENFGRIGLKIGEAVLPAFTKLADVLVEISKVLSDLPGPVQAIVIGVGLLAAGFLLLAPAISATVMLLGTLAGLQLGATIAGWLGALGPFIAGFQAALTGLLAWVSGTFLPGLLTFFSGPVGWTVLAVAAVVAMVIAFRKPIGDFLSWFGQIWEKSLRIIGGFLYDVFVAKWIKLYDATLREPVQKMFKWLSESWIEAGAFLKKTMLKVADAIKAPFVAISNVIRDALRSTLQWVANGANTAINLLNNLIEQFNKVPGIKLQPIANVSIPEFADGGVVNRPTLAMVGEGGEREYIIPESKMARAAAAYMGGARGDAVLAGPATINVTTGPVMQQQGQQWVTMADLQRAMRTTESATLARLRTPAGRAAAGVRNG